MRNVLLVLLATSLAGQAIVSPTHFALAEGGSSNPNPFGMTEQLARYLQIHEDLPGGPQTISSLSLRRNSDGSFFPSFSIDADIFCSIPATTAAAPDATFANNHSRAVQVARQRHYDFPATGASTLLPQPFEYRLPFDLPFTCDDRLCWEVQILGRSNRSRVHFDSVPQSGLDNPNPLPATLFFGTGCIPSGQTAPFRATGTAIMDWPINSCRMTFSASGGPANAVAISILGFDNARYAGLPLPFPFPGSGSGASGPCFIQNDVVVTLFGATNATGTYTSPLLTLPLHDGLHGATIFHHVVAFDANANAAGVVTTDGLGRQLVAPYRAPAIGLVAVNGHIGQVGTISANTGLIVRFD